MVVGVSDILLISEASDIFRHDSVFKRAFRHARVRF